MFLYHWAMLWLCVGWTMGPSSRVSRNTELESPLETPRGSRRAGFTVLEVVIALFLLTVCLLALAGTNASTIRMVAQGRLDNRTSTAVMRRMEQLRQLPCDEIVGGTDLRGPVLLQWTVDTLAGGRARLVTLHAIWAAGLGRKTVETALTAIC